MKYEEGDRGNLREILENFVEEDWSVLVDVSCIWEDGTTFKDLLQLDGWICKKSDVDKKQIDYEVEILDVRYEGGMEVLLEVGLIDIWDKVDL